MTFDFEQYLAPEHDRRETRLGIDSPESALQRLYDRGPHEWRKVRDRLEEKLSRDSPDSVASGCIDWCGPLTASATPIAWLYGRRVAVARILWVAAGNRPSEDKQRMVRSCSRLACVNPAHLTPADTIAVANAAKTECAKGHAYTPRSTVYYRGRRYCIPCHGADEDDLACDLFYRSGRQESAFGYFCWDEALGRYTTREERQEGEDGASHHVDSQAINS